MSYNESTNIQTKKYYRAKELAEYLSCGVSSIWRFNKQGKIKAYKMGGNITVFNIDEIEKDFIKEGTYE
ncbi:MAG: helix-turn-helix domain-containing protein [Campylobacteraceae bacterium]|nr:helix-turn-helix domain-containing protein [Campylobacteraceae bacterium]